MSRTEKRKTILFGVLDWGLGHATRSMPLIDALLALDHEVILAGSGAAARLLQETYPRLRFLSLPENKIAYGRHAGWSALLQSPRLLLNIQREHRLVAAFLKKEPVDLIVSDNRYGLYHPETPAIFLTHQLELLPPADAEKMAFLWRYVWKKAQSHLFRPFRQIWVPDYEKADQSLAGDLSRAAAPLPLRYLGPLSRFSPAVENTAPKAGLLLLLSGPEPQRSRLEKLLLDQLPDVADPVTLVRGLPGNHQKLTHPLEKDRLRIFNHLDAAALQALMVSHACIIARSGYSTLMDLQRLGGRAAFIPTPGQPEQEYLARRMAAQGIAPWQEQTRLHLAALLQETRHFSGFQAENGADYRQLWNETLSSSGI